MKKLIPLLVIAAGAVAYSIYKNKKETEQEEKKLVVVEDTPENDQPSDDTRVEEFENQINEVEEAAQSVQEVQEDLGVFETLTDLEEPYERPSFFHLTQDSYLEPEQASEPEETEVQENDVEPALIILETEEPAEAEAESEPVDELAEEVGMIDTVVEPEQVVEEVEDLVQEEENFKTFENTELEEAEMIEETAESEELYVEEEPAEEVQEDIQIDDIKEDEEMSDYLMESNDIEDVIEGIAQKIEAAADEYLSAEESEENVEESEDQELEPLVSYDTPELEALMKEIAGQVKAADDSESKTVEELPLEYEEEQVEEAATEPDPVEETDYLQDIRKITEMYSDKVAQYNIRYPYLSSRFIDDTLKFSQQFNAEYPQGTRIVIEHQAHFNASEDLFVFAQIIRQIGYSVRESAENHSLIVMKEMYVDTNTILHDVFKVANQVYCLSGEYQKFRITKR